MPDSPPKRTARRALLRLVAGAVTISFAPVLVRSMDTSPTTAAFWRCLIAGCLLLVISSLRAPRGLPPRRTLVAVFAAGAFFAADLTVWHRSIHLVGPGVATLLSNFQVFVLAAVGILIFREPLRARVVLAAALAFVGLALIVGANPRTLTSDARAGIVFGLLTAVVYAGYILSLRRARTPATSVETELGFASLFAALFLLPTALALGEPIAVDLAREGPLLVAYALVAQVLGWWLISGALDRVPAFRVGLILLLQPTLAFVWDVLFFHREVGLRDALGATLALVAVFIGSTVPLPGAARSDGTKDARDRAGPPPAPRAR